MFLLDLDFNQTWTKKKKSFQLLQMWFDVPFFLSRASVESLPQVAVKHFA